MVKLNIIFSFQMDQLKCFFEVQIDGRDHGRIIFNLFKDKCPKTCENFRCLCTGEKGSGKRSGKALYYKGSQFHRVVRDFIIQGGDITDANGKGGDSIYEGSFADENLELKHDEPYLLSMANRGPDTNRSQFFITTAKAPHLDGKHVIFGRVVSGFDIIDKIERLEVDSKSRPLKKVIIKECGQLNSDHNRLPMKYQIANSQRRKRKLSASSRSSDDSQIIRRHRNKSRSSSRCSGSSESSFSCSSSSSSAHYRSYRSPSSRTSTASSPSSPSTYHSPRRERRRTPSVSSIDRSPHRRDVIPKRRRKSRTKRRSRTRKLTKSSPINDDSNESSVDQKRKRSRERTKRQAQEPIPKRQPEPNLKRPQGDLGEAPFHNPHYKCSIKPDEIPEVPVNRFLLREPMQQRPPRNEERLRAKSKHKRGDSEEPNVASNDGSNGAMTVDQTLSLPKNTYEANETQQIQQAAVSVDANQSKASNEPLLSKSGRIMRGRGTFKFRTPSPDDKKSERYTRDNRSHRERNSYRDRNRNRDRSSRWSRSRSRSRNRSPPYLYSDRDRNQRSYR